MISIISKIKNKPYYLVTSIISLTVAVLIHFPELVSLFDKFESQTLFPGMTFTDVANEVFFTFISLLLLFFINTRFFHFDRTLIRISWQKMIVSFVLTWVLSNLLGQGFVFLHSTLNIPAINAMVHHYLHPLRDFIMSSLVTTSCYIIYLIRRQQQVVIENQQLQAENIL
ncbi:MAG: histidine kinase, partial [Rikenellaceae bacterium]